MPTLAELGQLVKKKYPGSYDSMDDRELASAVQKKHPGSYDNFKDDDYSDPLKGFKVSSPGTPPKVDIKEEPMSPVMTGVARVSEAAGRVKENADKPLITLPKPDQAAKDAGVGQKVARGLARAGVKNVENFVTPKNIAIAGGLAAINAGAAYFPPAIPVAQAANATAATYFGADMIGSIPEQYSQYRDQVKQGDWEGAAESTGNMAATAAMAGAATRGGVEMLRPKPNVAPVSKAAVENHLNLREVEKDPAAAMGIRPFAPKTVPGTSPGQIKAKAQDIAAQDIVGKPFGKLSKEEAAQVNAALRDKELRKHYEQQATDALPQGDQILPDGSPVPLGPDLKAAQANRKAKLAAKFGTRAEREAAYQEGLADAQRKPATPPELEWPAPLKSAEESAAVLGDIPVQPAIESAGTFAEQNRVRTPQEWTLTDAQGRPAPPPLEAPVIKKPSGSFSGRAEAPKPPTVEAPQMKPTVPVESGMSEQPTPDLKWNKYAPKGEDGFDYGYDLTSSFKAGSAESPRNGEVSIFYKADEQFPTFDVVIEERGTPNKRGEVHRESFDWVGEEAAKQVAAKFMEDAGFSAPRDPSAVPGTRTPTRDSSQRGGLTVPNPFAPKQQQNLSPSERHFQEQAAIRDKAKAGADSTFMDRLEKLRQAYRTTFNDTTVAATDRLKPLDALAGPGVLKATTKMHNFIDKVYRSSSIATRMIQDAGFEHVLKNAENLTYLDQFMIARRAAELEANGFRTGRDRAMDAQAVKDFGNRIAVPATKTNPAMTYAQVADKFTAFNNQLLDMSVKSGVVNADIAAHLKAKYKNYVPIDRVMDAVESAHRGAQGASQIASLSRQTIVQKLVGSERLIDDSIVSSIQRADRVMNQVTRNDAATHLTDSLTQLDPTGTGGLIRKLKQGETGPSDRTIHRYANGVKESYVTTPELAAAAKSLDVKQLGWVVQNFFSPAVRLMKTFTTGLSLPFTVANVIRDMGHTAITQKGGIGGLFSPEVWREAGDVLAGKSEVVKNMEREGGGFSSFDLSRGQVTPEVELMRAKRGAGDAVKYLRAHPVRSVGALFRATENLLSRSEQIGRARVWQTVYARAIKEGYSKADAQIVATVESNNVLPNYSRAGSLGRTLNAIIPYFNARIQGVRSLTRAFEQNPTGTISKVGALFGAVVAGAAYNLMDEKRKAVYFDMPEYERRTNIVVVGPNAKKDARGRWTGILKVPLPQGLDSLSDVWRKSVEMMHGGDPVGFNDIAESLIGAFTPVDPLPVSKNIGANLVAGVATTMTPQLVKPTIQSISNRDFFRQQPKEPLSMQDLPAQDRAHPYTSGTAKAVARDVLPKVGIETSPIKVEEFVKDTFGGGGGMVVNLVDRAAMAAGAIPEQPIGGQGPIDATVSRLTSGRGGDYDTHYYELRKQAQDIIAHRNIAMLQSNPNFSKLPRETQQKLTRSAVAKARVAIGKVTKDGKLDDAPGPQKVEVMRQFLDRIK